MLVLCIEGLLDVKIQKKINIKENIPVFVSKGEDEPLKDRENVFRDSVILIVKHPSENSYLFLKSKKRNYNCFITGGVENNENYEEAAIRELLEETGYFDVKSIINYNESLLNYFYAKSSNVNKLVKYNIVYIQLNSLKMNQVDITETEKHTVKWEDANSIYNILTSKSNRYAFDIVYNGREDKNILKKYNENIRKISIGIN